MDHIDSLFLYEKWKKNECWKTQEDVEQGLEKMETKGGKIESLKDNMNVHAKGLGLKQYHIAMSTKTLDQLKDHLLFVIRDGSDKPKECPFIKAPKVKDLPVLGEKTCDVRIGDDENIDEVVEMEKHAVETRNEMIISGERDEIRLMQPVEAPTLKIGLKIQVSCNYFNHDSREDNMDW